MKYAIRAERGNCYVCKGSFIYQGEPFKVIGKLENARIFKSKEAAEKELDRLKGKYANMDSYCCVVEIDG